MNHSQTTSKRAAKRLPYTLHVNFGGLEKQYAGIAVNVSSGGMLVATCEPVLPGTRFAAEFDVGAGHVVRAPVETVWTHYVTTPDERGQAVAEMGLRFLSLTHDDRGAIERFVSERPEN